MKSQQAAASEKMDVVIGMDPTTPHRASEPLIYEISVAGRQGFALPPLDVPQKPIETSIPREHLRVAPAPLPEVSERELVKHFMRLAHLNFSVETNFYPLGSCTMKYNPRINEELTFLPGFAKAHPYEPDSAVQGMMQLLYGLERDLGDILGMDAVTLQPAAGAHGEFTGLLIARAYHAAKGKPRRKVVVPDSSHGTNPASAALCGYEVVEVASNARGRVDLDLLKKAIDQETAVFMLTNPNTLGLFEEQILEISKIVHDAGALMYLDGANMNALLGLYKPGEMGFDITHVNIHKTFSIPHGSGGPGGGPVGVKKHLAGFLPGPRIVKEASGLRWDNSSKDSIGRVRAFYGNTGALIRCYAYIRALGADGLKHVSENAILNANYLRVRLSGTYSVPINEPCMHEFVASAAECKRQGVKAMDIGKRLLDFGCYAPTISFPLIVEEALMIEPSETESKQALDYFVDALLTIAHEIKHEPARVQTAPHSLPVARLDEVKAAREPNLRWRHHG